MNKQIAGLFDRFYTIALKDKIQDPLLHSEWNYFQSMLASSNFQRQRINMYLGILEKQKRKKEGVSQFQFNSIGYEPKMQKRFSQPVKNMPIGDITVFQLKQQEPIQPQSQKPQKMLTPKSKQGPKRLNCWDSKQRPSSRNSNTNPNTNSNSKPLSVLAMPIQVPLSLDQKPNYRKLQEAALNLVRLFEISVNQ